LQLHDDRDLFSTGHPLRKVIGDVENI